MLLQLLGTISAGDGSSEPLAISAPRLRLLLAILGANHGAPVSTDRLIDLVWDDDPPTTAPAAIQVGISKLRTIFEPDRAPREPSSYLHTDGPNYILELPTEHFDIARFEDLADRGRSMTGDEAAARQALESWREPPFAELTDASWALEPSRRLRALRDAVARDRLARAVRDRAEAPLLGELAAERERNPDDERLAGLEMVALYRSGRQDQAVAVYQTLRARLRDERGLDPTPELQRLEQAILRHDDRALGPPSGAARLPRRRGPLYGRADDLARLGALVDDTRLVTVLGPGGVGKTALLHELVASRERAPLAWVDLAERPHPSGVARALTDHLGIEEQPSVDPLAAAADVLGDADGLLVFDNCEPVIDAIRSTVSTLLDRCPALTIVCTSRVPTDLLAETTLTLGPLPAPDDESDGDDENPCVQLLRHRCGPDDVPRGPALRELCAQLDGLPLALELAAFHLRTLSPRAVLDQMNARVLEGPEDLPSRHRTLHALVRDSVAQLDPAAVAVLDAVATCQGRVTPDFVGAILGDTSKADPSLILADLARRGLLTAHRDDEADSYSALETVRADRRTALVEADRWPELTARHAHAVGALVRQNSTGGGAAAIDRVGPEILEALDRLEARGDDESLHLHLVTDAGTFWYRSGQVHNALERMRAALETHPDAPPALRGTVAAAISLMSFSVGDHRSMASMAALAQSIFASVGLPPIPTIEAAAAVAEGRLDDADRFARDAADRLDPSSREGVIARDMAANVAWLRGAHEEARNRFEDLEQAAEAAGERYFIGRALRGRAVMLAWEGAPEAAAALCARSEAFIDDARVDRGTSQLHVVRAAIALEFGDLDRAGAEATRCLRQCVRQFDAQPVTVAVPILCHVEGRRGDHAGVGRLSGWLRGLCDSTGMYPPAHSLSLLASAEAVSADALGPSAWAVARASGAAARLAELVEKDESPTIVPGGRPEK